ncbi:hypothetical protein EYZ11_006431 [Aspergillus tanneri]|uniref:Uncharacterized protein n=1 Tax=Aspergillus tanneri TaxID=1220188 RepID=A0A4S3JFV2_9EURO|nr:uncharacterized protein ATNIH1004_004764 [Aspergillus tanneri]KAA8648878.1 hypothetical protein ATNIH1004_004764 [Aspergillus tanneri]THC94102.1 hypothetical protein EYZ11_006431 [Aspergillus tanneri]
MPSIKPILEPLKTPQPMVFPSELQGNDTGCSLSGNGKNEEGLSTPITPPAAYTEFLKAFTPIFSPDSARAENSRFSFDRPLERQANTPTSQPTSAASSSFNFSEPARSATASLPPPTPYGAPFPRRDPRSLRSLRIPPRYSPTTMTESPRSATMLRSPYSPPEWKTRYHESPRSANGRVSVRHVITHTITYKRTQLEDPPKGKRRRVNESSRSDDSDDSEDC